MENTTVKISRKCVDIEDFARFKIPEEKLDKQYSNIYNARLDALRDILVAKAKQKWVHHRIIKISDVSGINNEYELIIIVGTLYKHQELKPSVLRELSNELQLPPQPARSKNSCGKDNLFLEDETHRIELVGNGIDSKELVTGLVCAVLGHRIDNETLWVEDHCMPGMCSKISQSDTPITSNKKLLLLSGLGLGNDMDSIAFELLIEFINGMAGDQCAHEIEASITQVIITGNNANGFMDTFTHHGSSIKKDKSSVVALGATLAANKFDSMLSRIAATCCVFVMPAQFDPTNHSIPQQPLHSCILPNASRYKNFYATTNPWIGRFGERIVAGSSGQPIEDIMKVAGLVEYSPLEWLEKTLLWRHFAPTAPDTLSAYSYFNCDPFVMLECPDIYFVGNMEEYATKLAIGDEGQNVRLISIPKFSQSHTGVVVDLGSLDTWPISFGKSQ